MHLSYAVCSETFLTFAPLHLLMQLCNLLKSRVESPEFLEKLDNIQKSVYQHGAGAHLPKLTCHSFLSCLQNLNNT